MDLKLCLTVRGIVLGLSGGAFLQRATIFFHRLTANLFFFFVGDALFVLALKLDDHQHEAHDLINKEQNKRDDHDAQEAGAALQEAEEAAEAVPLGVAFFPSANDVLDVEGVSIRRSVVVTLGAEGNVFPFARNADDAVRVYLFCSIAVKIHEERNYVALFQFGLLFRGENFAGDHITLFDGGFH